MRVLVCGSRHTDKIPEGAIYVGRPSKWGNPYRMGKDGDRETVIRLYETYLLRNFYRKYIIRELI